MRVPCALCACLMVTSISSVTAVALRSRAASREGMHLQAQVGTQLGLNPMRKVVILLQRMLKANEEMCAEKAKLCEDAHCACKAKIAAQQKIVDHYAGELDVLEAEYKELYAEVHGLKLDLKLKKGQLGPLKERLAELIALHDREYADAQKILQSYQQNINATAKAIYVLETGNTTVLSTDNSTENSTENETGNDATASFLQSSTAGQLRSLLSATMSSKMSDTDRDDLQAFLDQGTSEATEVEAPGTDEVIGILKQMKDTMEEDLEKFKRRLAELFEHFKERFELEKQIKLLEDWIITATIRLGEAMERLSELDRQIRDILGGGYLREKTLLDEIIKACEAEALACNKTKLMCAQESHALGDVLELLNSDESMTLFKRTIHGASLLQTGMSSKHLLKRANEALNSARRQGNRDYRVNVISLAMQGKKVDFTEVIQMIYELMGVLAQEEKDDYAKKHDCEKSLREAFYRKLFLDKKMEPIKKALALLEDELKKIQDELKLITDALHEMNEIVEAEKKKRAKEHLFYLKELNANNGAMDLLKVAKMKLEHFYGTSFSQVEPTIEEGKPQDAKHVLRLIGEIIHDLQMHMDENKDEEQKAVEALEEFIKDGHAAREEKLDMMMGLRNQEDAAQQKVQDFKDEYREIFKEEELLLRTIAGLHKTCDWLMENFEWRLAARRDEIQALRNAKTVLQGGKILE